MRAIQSKTKPSRTLLITGVKDIGLRSESIDCGVLVPRKDLVVRNHVVYGSNLKKSAIFINGLHIK